MVALFPRLPSSPDLHTSTPNFKKVNIATVQYFESALILLLELIKSRSRPEQAAGY
jgi:hypothetical protein